MLILKLTDKNRRTFNAFLWPESGWVQCPNWDSEPVCGGGLHGWANGCGDYRHSFNEGQWLVVDVPSDTAVSLDGGDKVKFPAGNVVYCGSREGAVKYLIEHGALTADSNPALACFTMPQLVDLAMRSADRAVRVHAPRQLRAKGLVKEAERLETLHELVDQHTASVAALAARHEADYAVGTIDAACYVAADAAARAAHAAGAVADYAALAADTAADARAAAAVAFAAARAADTTADARAAAAAAAAAAVAADTTAEREAHRLDKLQILGLV